MKSDFDFTFLVSSLLDLLSKLTVGEMAAAENCGHVFAGASLNSTCSPRFSSFLIPFSVNP